MIGIDILEIDRVQKLYSDKFLQKVFTDSEQQYILSQHNTMQTVAGMYCAKEAVVKALGCGFGDGVGFHQIIITHTNNHCPQVVLHGKCQEILQSLGFSQVYLSISHNDSTAVAVAVLR